MKRVSPYLSFKRSQKLIDQKTQHYNNTLSEGIMASIEEIFSSLPPIFPRSAVGKLTHGIIQPGTCCNLDSLGTGVAGRIRINGRICYLKEDFIKWMESRTNPPQGKK
jgi:hypothetical protein